jgi:hypothetical protein
MTSPKQADELLPCPFCGAQAEITHRLNFNWARCSYSDCFINNHEVSPERWNRRSHLQPPGEWQRTAQLNGRQIAIAWFESEEGKKCLEGFESNRYHRNRLEAAFIAGASIARCEHQWKPDGSDLFSCIHCTVQVTREQLVTAFKSIRAAAPSSGDAIDDNDRWDTGELGRDEKFAVAIAEPPAAEALFMEANSLCRSALSIAEREGKETNWEAFRNRLKESLAKQLPVINSLRDVSTELTIEETQRLLGAESPIPVNMPTDPMGLAAGASEIFDQLRHPSPVAQGEAVEIHGWVACERPGYPFTRAESYQLVYCQRNSDGQFFKFYLPVIPAAPPKPTAPDGGGL